jgi:superkiller protein 3
LADKKNGMAYIFLGAAYQDTNKPEAAKYLKTALEFEDSKLIALQGLSNCAKPEELPEILQQLLKLTPDKFSDHYTKLYNLVNQLTNHSMLIEIFCHEIKIEEPDQTRKYQALKSLLNIFVKNRDLAHEKYKDEFLECLEIGFQDKNHVHHVEICRDYFQILNQKNKLEELIQGAEEMSSVYENNVVPLEWICKVYIENESFAISEHLKSNFGMYVERLLELNPNSVLGLMASALVKFTIGDLAGSRDILVKGKLIICFKACNVFLFYFSQSIETKLVDVFEETLLDSYKTSSLPTC